MFVTSNAVIHATNWYAVWLMDGYPNVLWVGPSAVRRVAAPAHRSATDRTLSRVLKNAFQHPAGAYPRQNEMAPDFKNPMKVRVFEIRSGASIARAP